MTVADDAADRTRQVTARSPVHTPSEREPASFAVAGSARIAVADAKGLPELLVASVGDYAIFALDPTGHVLSWNEGAHRLKGYTADEIIGRAFFTVYPAEI